MTSRVASPFLVLSDSAVEAGPWMLGLDEKEEQAAADYLPDWDYASHISLRRTVSLNWELAAADLDVSPSNLELCLLVKAGTGAGRLPRSIILRQSSSFTGSANTVTIEMQLPGQLLSVVLDLVTEIVVENSLIEAGALSPTKSGERVWQDRHRIQLEGEELRFPIEVADLGTLFAGGAARSAPWYVHWSPSDWSRDLHGAMRLFLNKDHPYFIERVTEGDPETLRAIMADVMSQICESFVSLENCEELAGEAAEGTLGSQAYSWIKAAWPDRDLRFVRSLLKSRPGEFRAALHSLAEQRGRAE